MIQFWGEIENWQFQLAYVFVIILLVLVSLYVLTGIGCLIAKTYFKIKDKEKEEDK